MALKVGMPTGNGGYCAVFSQPSQADQGNTAANKPVLLPSAPCVPVYYYCQKVHNYLEKPPGHPINIGIRFPNLPSKESI